MKTAAVMPREVSADAARLASGLQSSRNELRAGALRADVPAESPLARVLTVIDVVAGR